jgi:hypothetical protein
MKFLVNSGAGRFTAKLNGTVSKKDQIYNWLKLEGGPQLDKGYSDFDLRRGTFETRNRALLYVLVQ